MLTLADRLVTCSTEVLKRTSHNSLEVVRNILLVASASVREEMAEIIVTFCKKTTIRYVRIYIPCPTCTFSITVWTPIWDIHCGWSTFPAISISDICKQIWNIWFSDVIFLISEPSYLLTILYINYPYFI